VGEEVPQAFLAFQRRAQAEPAAIRRFFEALAGTLVDADGRLVGAAQADRQAVVCRLYYRGRDEGYDDAQSIPVALDPSDRVLDVNFRLPPDARPDYLRIDFADFPGIYHLQRVTLNRRGGEEKALEGLRGRLGYVHGEMLPALHENDVRLASFDHDPYLEFEAGTAMQQLAGEGIVEVKARVGYEIVLDDPLVSQLVGRYTVAIQEMAELSRQRVDLRELSGLQARQQFELNQRMQQLEETVRQLANQSVWSKIRKGTG
jgi:hypothetical protein